LHTGERVGLTLGLVALFAGGYFGLAALSAGSVADAAAERAAALVRTALDDHVPLLPAGVWLYSTVYTALSIPLFVVRSRSLFRRVSVACSLVLGVCFASFAFFPVNSAALRAEVPIAGTGISAWGLQVVYALDPPWNCFPSLHVAIATVIAVVVTRSVAGSGWLAWSWWFALGLSTLVTRQHYVLDVVAGAVVGGLAALLAFADQVREEAEGSWRGIQCYAALHGVFVGAFALVYVLGP
jgi:membrane-associated phospholipid phosphatase